MDQVCVVHDLLEVGVQNHRGEELGRDVEAKRCAGEVDHALDPGSDAQPVMEEVHAEHEVAGGVVDKD